MKKDELFQNTKYAAHDFEFNQDVARVFDDMVMRSIPYYQMLQDLVVTLAYHHASPSYKVYDLGCSTAFTLRQLYKKMTHEGISDFELIGYDQSLPMIEQAELWFRNERFDPKKIYCVPQDIMQRPSLEGASVVLCLFTLQFIRPIERAQVLAYIYQAIPSKATVIIAEKTVSACPTINRTWIDLYHQYKKDHGYSDTEIAAKREALENVLIPFRDQENIDLLYKSGFQEVELAWKWLNFSCYLAHKS